MKKNGYSLIEILVVLAVFSLLATIATQTIFLTLRSSRKVEASIKVRESLDNAVSVMERQLRNAKSVTSGSTTQIDYIDNTGNAANFRCVTSSPNYIASGSASLTSSDINLTSCTFSYVPATTGVPASVSISLTGTQTTSSGVEGATATVVTRIFLRQ